MATPEVEAPAQLNPSEFDLACSLIAQYAGIKLGPHKRYMVYNRLVRRLRAHAMRDFGQYLQLVQTDVMGEREAFVNALTTNLTAFFREPHHFDLLAERAKLHQHNQRRPMRIWSCACSTGEEPWSIAMTLREAGCDAQVVASDIDTDALEKAASGVYAADRIADLPASRLRGHFLRGTGANDGRVMVRPELRSMVKFGQLNLQSPRWPAMEAFDAVFCRNVTIYFDREAQKKLLERLAQVLRPGGVLVVGHAESFPATHRSFRGCGRTAYEYLPA
ncbi:CheR family methyltransferase [Ramlibacter tataouinensis]|uniref:CheR family methyltransferase n=1 Tax=Ramlibacter tataouinensis TaxID=94132 RepID=UPI000776C305|nr:CheR family methyltransferase [Ramlibacter tataouinensis]